MSQFKNIEVTNQAKIKTLIANDILVNNASIINLSVTNLNANGIPIISTFSVGSNTNVPQPSTGVIRIFSNNASTYDIDFLTKTAGAQINVANIGNAFASTEIRVIKKGPDGNLYIGGAFTSMGNVSANCIISYNTNTNIFSQVSNTSSPINGVNGRVNTIEFAGPASNFNMYLGGEFNALVTGLNTVSSTIGNLAIYNNVSGWVYTNPTNTAITSGIRALKYDPITNLLFIGGNFISVNLNGSTTPSTVQRICQLSNSDNPTFRQFSVTNPFLVNNGIASAVNALELVSNTLYVGGQFSSINTTGVNVPVYKTVKINNLTGARTVSALSSTNFSSGFEQSNVVVNSLYHNNNILYIGGSFNYYTEFTSNNTLTTATFMPRLCTYNILSNTIAPVVSNQFSNTYPFMGYVPTSFEILNLNVSGDDLYIAGRFPSVDGKTTNGLCKYNLVNKTFDPMTNNIPYSGTALIDTYFTTYPSDDNTLYVGGNFLSTNNSIPTAGIQKINQNGFVYLNGTFLFRSVTYNTIKLDQDATVQLYGLDNTRYQVISTVGNVSFY